MDRSSILGENLNKDSLESKHFFFLGGKKHSSVYQTNSIIVHIIIKCVHFCAKLGFKLILRLTYRFRELDCEDLGATDNDLCPLQRSR